MNGYIILNIINKKIQIKKNDRIKRNRMVRFRRFCPKIRYIYSSSITQDILFFPKFNKL